LVSFSSEDWETRREEKVLLLTRIHFGFIVVDSPKPVSVNQYFYSFVIHSRLKSLVKLFTVDLLFEQKQKN